MPLGFRHFLKGGKARPAEHEAPKYLMVAWVDYNENPRKSRRRFILIGLDHVKEQWHWVMESETSVKGEHNFSDYMYQTARKLVLKKAKASWEQVLFLDQDDEMWMTPANPYRHYKRVNKW